MLSVGMRGCVVTGVWCVHVISVYVRALQIIHSVYSLYITTVVGPFISTFVSFISN